MYFDQIVMPNGDSLSAQKTSPLPKSVSETGWFRKRKALLKTEPFFCTQTFLNNTKTLTIETVQPISFILQYLVIALKILVPFSMLFFPFAGVWANYFLDVIDGDVLGFLGMNEFAYQTVDKACDYVSYIFMLILGSRLRIRKLIIFLFIYRTIGQILFFITRNEMFFFYFQNLMEPLLMIYTLLMFKFKSEEKAYIYYKKHLVIIWAIILAYKIWNEWYLHLANIDLSTIFFGFNG